MKQRWLLLVGGVGCGVLFVMSCGWGAAATPAQEETAVAQAEVRVVTATPEALQAATPNASAPAATAVQAATRAAQAPTIGAPPVVEPTVPIVTEAPILPTIPGAGAGGLPEVFPPTPTREPPTAEVVPTVPDAGSGGLLEVGTPTATLEPPTPTSTELPTATLAPTATLDPPTPTEPPSRASGGLPDVPPAGAATLIERGDPLGDQCNPATASICVSPERGTRGTMFQISFVGHPPGQTLAVDLYAEASCPTPETDEPQVGVPHCYAYVTTFTTAPTDSDGTTLFELQTLATNTPNIYFVQLASGRRSFFTLE